jgi:hypothetical protein
LDLNVSASSDAKSINEQNPLDILASQAVRMFEHTNQAQVVDGMQLTLPNQCSYEGCGAPLHLVPEHCSTIFSWAGHPFQHIALPGLLQRRRRNNNHLLGLIGC